MTSSKWVKKLCMTTALTATFLVAPTLFAPESLAQVSGPAITFQSGQLANHARIAVDIPGDATYSITVNDRVLRITLDSVFSPDFSAFGAANLRQIGNPRVSYIGGRTLIDFDVLPGVSPRDFRSGNFLIVDVYGGDQTASLPAFVDSGAFTPPPATGDEPETGEPIEENTDTSGGEGVPAENNLQNDDELGSTTDISTVSRQEQSGPIRLLGLPEVTNPDQEAVDVAVTEVENGISLSFNWPIDAAAAVFERGEYLWVVFDQTYAFDPKGMIDAGSLVSDRIHTVEQLEHLDALVLRMSVRTNQNYVVEKDARRWIVYLKDTPAKPRFPIIPERRNEGANGQQIFVAASDVGRKIEVEDPDIGDYFVVMPLARQGSGLAQDFSYASAELAETAQGIVITPLTDFVNVERYTDGVAISSSGNDFLSSSRLSRATGIGSDLQTGFARLIDFANWRIGPSWEYRKNKTRLLYELSLRQLDDRNEVRWKLARYYLAHGRAAEALGILERMLEEDPLLSQNTEFLAVRGVANFKQGRLDAALADLSARELEAEQDAELWLLLVEEKKGHYEKALEHYRRGKDVMGTYDTNDRAEISLAAVRSAIETGDIELAQQELALLNGVDLNEDQLLETLFQAARISEMQGDFDTAFAQYDELTGASNRWISARARYARIRYGLRNGDLNYTDAIDQLERLRYAWRGDKFEITLLNDLAEYYFATKQYTAGLSALRAGVSYYPEEASELKMLLRMGQVFKDLFVNNGADEMTPVAAISLFYQFQDLTPLGPEGDFMVRRLAARMVSVDLLDNAASLLEYQVSQRTEGAARAQIAAQLAKIYIMDSRPEQAIEILRATREPRLPNDIVSNRRHVEARALVEQGRYEEAEVMLEDDSSADAEVLRTDIFWGSKEWPKLINTVQRILGDGWRRNQALNSLQRLNLIRLTIGMTFMDDRAGLIEMRRRYGNQMRSGDFANAFELLTNDQELSGRELGAIASQIASVEKLQTFMREYRSDFSGR
ncbi:tetratricopeptide repeat protein [Kordiimonas laminariae]|uniref:tetratricopeptide repeat protein n=1 Tax=Kordiimonas laminariae TaxID=2917717 RepID=UPI001FF4CDFE|nr:hypothetical protein [Kordiimonas laminariae]MCK0070460.1 hypothetical protein [Kordiimonas laminariae]